VIRVGSIPVVQYDVAPERNCAYRCNQRNPHNAAIYQAYHRCITSSLSLTRPASLSASSARPWWCPGRRYKKALERFAPDYLPTLKPRTHERHRTSFPLRQPACGWITRPIQKSPSLTIGGSWLSAWVSTPLPDRIQNHVYYEQREAGAGGADQGDHPDRAWTGWSDVHSDGILRAALGGLPGKEWTIRRPRRSG
jgi:hypothetical protein